MAFECGPVEMRLPAFLRYAARCREEKPLYLFDKRFFDKAPPPPPYPSPYAPPYRTPPHPLLAQL